MNWNFRQGGKTENPKDAGIKEFAKHIFESVVREATQNAIDNRRNKEEPVIIKYEFGSIDKNKIPCYAEIEKRWNACYDKWKDQAQYEIILKDVLDRIKSFDEKVPYLSVSDYNTKGMEFTSDIDIDKTRYGAFSRGNHSFHDSDSAAGSEGQGKAALYAISAMRTMFVHTISEKGHIYEGLSRLATHNYLGERYNSDGYFPHSPTKPEYENQTKKPQYPFMRPDNELGTTISLIGLWHYNDVEKNMIKAAINNFWMAIYEGDLIIKVGDTELNRNNIENLINHYLPERFENNKTKSNPTEYGRAKCYFETWSNKNTSECEFYKETIKHIGECILKISHHPDYPGKVAFFREQKMLILRSVVNSFVSKGYCGVFLCSDKEGNKLLRMMEGKTHTEWDPSLCPTPTKREEGKIAIEGINAFIHNSWKKYREKHFPQTIDLKGLGGLSISKNSIEEKEKISSNKKKLIIPSPNPKPQPEFKKFGIVKKGLRTKKENGNWKYSLILKSNDEKSLSIIMMPATDSGRTSEEDLLKIIKVSEGWINNENVIVGNVKKGDNLIEFCFDEDERIALDIKINSI